MKTYSLEINHEACWGCKTCEIACKQENRAPDGVKLIAVFEDGPAMVAGKLDFVFRVNLCRHCHEPPCVDACPEEAITKRSDSIVIMDDALCSGCQLCIAACPYDAIEFDTDKGIARKCNLCHHRIERGLIPACADNICPAHCIYFSISDTPLS